MVGHERDLVILSAHGDNRCGDRKGPGRGRDPTGLWFPGGEVLVLIDELRKAGVDFVLMRHEANAGIAAAVHGKLRGQPGVVLNHPLFPAPTGNSLNPTTTTFGTISASTQQNYARRTQVMVKFIF